MENFNQTQKYTKKMINLIIICYPSFLLTLFEGSFKFSALQTNIRPLYRAEISVEDQVSNNHPMHNRLAIRRLVSHLVDDSKVFEVLDHNSMALSPNDE